MFPNLVIKVLDQFPKTSQKKETGRKMPKLEKALCQPQKRRQGRKSWSGWPKAVWRCQPDLLLLQIIPEIRHALWNYIHVVFNGFFLCVLG